MIQGRLIDGKATVPVIFRLPGKLDFSGGIYREKGNEQR